MSFVLPKRTHLVQKAIDPSKLSKKAAADLLVDGQPRPELYFHQRKYDGCHVFIVRSNDGELHKFSRDGKPVNSLGHLDRCLYDLPPGVYFAEAWFPNAEHRVINGTFRRSVAQPELELRFFDVVTLEGFQEGIERVAYGERREALEALLYRHCKTEPRILIAHNCFSWEAAELAAHPTDAYDGAVAWNKLSYWYAGAGKEGSALKIKNIVDLDLEVIGLNQEFDKNGEPKESVGSLVVRFAEGKELSVGSGLTKLERRAWWLDPLDIKGRIVRVVGMKDSGKGSIREPRFKGIRWDKTEADH